MLNQNRILKQNPFIEETPPISEPAPNEEPEEQPSSQTLPWVFGILILLTVVSLTLRSRKNT